MKPTIIFVGGLTAAVTLALSSCGDDKSSVDESAVDKSAGADPSSAEPADSYPLKVCVVSGEDLGSMGKPHVITHNGTEVRFCCKACVGDFEKDPDKYLAMLKAGKADADPDPEDHSKHDQ